MWNKYKKDDPTITIYKTNGLIVQRLGEIASLMNQDSRTFTNRIKTELIFLGYEVGFCVYTCIKKKNNTEAEKIRMEAEIQRINNNIEPLIRKHELGKHRFRNREWLYDLHWYRDTPNTYYMPEILELAVESELDNLKRRGDISNSGYSEVKYDFQKLLVTNAKNRLMIFSVDDLDNDLYGDSGLERYFKNAIQNYKQLPADSLFTFICYHNTELLYKEILRMDSM